MNPRETLIVIIISLFSLTVESQDTWYGSMSGMQFMYNPAYTGSSGVPSVNLSCYSFLPGNGYDLRSVFASYDGYFESLHGGAGVWICDDIQGDIMNYLKTGVSYSFHLKAAKKLFFNAGITASVVHNGINRSAITLPEDFDPFGGIIGISSETISEKGNTFFDVSTGICFSTGTWHGGFSAMHLTRPYLTDDQSSFNRLRRMFTINLGGELPMKQGKIVLFPYASFISQGQISIIFAGLMASAGDILLGLSTWNAASGFFILEPSAGWRTGSATIIISYNYNVAGSSDFLPGTALVKAGLKISFNNVEKRKPVHVINIPEL